MPRSLLILDTEIRSKVSDPWSADLRRVATWNVVILGEIAGLLLPMYLIRTILSHWSK